MAEPPRWVAWATITVATVLTFGRGVPFGLLDGWDDERFLIENPLVQQVSASNLAAIFTQPHFQAYHPVHLLSYWLDVPWFGLNGPVIHGVSLALWILALIAVFEATRALSLGWLGALTVTLIVGCHPVQVEAVTWATGRKDILALGFCALAILFHFRSRALFDRWRGASLLAFALAALSKTTTLPLPLALVAADVLLWKRPLRRSLMAQAPALLVAIVCGAFTIWIWDESQMIGGRDIELGQRVALVAATLSHYLSTLFFPGSLSPMYPINRGDAWPTLTLLAGPLVSGAAALLAGRHLPSPHLRFSLVAFALFVAPVANVIPLYFQWQDRYVSLAIWPLAIAVGAGVDALAAAAPKGRRWAPWLGAGLVVLALGARTAQYIGNWRDALTLFGHAAATEPTSYYAWLNLGHLRAREGHLEGAVEAYDHAIENANLSDAHDARFRTVLLIDERDLDLSPSRADAMVPRFHAAMSQPTDLRSIGGELGDLGYRRGVMLALDYLFALDPLPDEQLEHAAVVQLERGHPWLADYYITRLRRPPITPALVERVRPTGPAAEPTAP